MWSVGPFSVGPFSRSALYAVFRSVVRGSLLRGSLLQVSAVRCVLWCGPWVPSPGQCCTLCSVVWSVGSFSGSALYAVFCGVVRGFLLRVSAVRCVLWCGPWVPSPGQRCTLCSVVWFVGPFSGSALYAVFCRVVHGFLLQVSAVRCVL